MREGDVRPSGPQPLPLPLGHAGWLGAGRSGRGLLVAGTLMVATVVALALVPPPHDPSSQVDSANSFFRPPGTTLLEVRQDDGQVWLADRIEISPAGSGADADRTVTVHGPRGTRTLAASRVQNLPVKDGDWQRRRFLLGSDHLGRDIFSRIISGARVSLEIGLLAVGLALTLGVAVGLLAAMAGGWVDALLMRLVDALLSIPQLFLIVTLATILDPSTRLVIVLLGGTLWMPISRLVRAEVLSVQERDFVLAARGLGISRLRLAVRHLLPNALTPVLVQATLAVGAVILAEAALSFFGLGIEPGTATWGQMIQEGEDYLSRAWWIVFFPGLAISWTVIAFNLLGDGLRDRLDPSA